MALSPANNASPSSKTAGIAWLVRAAPNSLSASRERRAAAAGIIFEPGSPACRHSVSRSRLARAGRNRNSPPTSVRRLRGASVKARTSAVAAWLAAARPGRSSSARRGSRAKPASLRMAQTAGADSGSPASASTAAMSWTERFCLRRAITRSRSRAVFVGGTGLAGAAGGRWVALAGSRKARSTSVSSLASPLNTPPLSQLAPARPAPRTACRQSYLHRCDSRRAGLGRANQLTLWEMVHRFDRELTSAGRPHEASPARSTVALARYPYVGIQARALAGPDQPDHVPDLVVQQPREHLRGQQQRQLVQLRLHARRRHGIRRPSQVEPRRPTAAATRSLTTIAGSA